jgi:hypothetical protein
METGNRAPPERSSENLLFAMDGENGNVGVNVRRHQTMKSA